MYDDNYQIGFKVATNSEGTDILGDKAGGVTYKDIEDIKKKITSDNPLQAKPTAKELADDEKLAADKRVYVVTCPTA